MSKRMSRCGGCGRPVLVIFPKGEKPPKVKSCQSCHKVK